MALPPASAISATTSCAGPVSCPEPSTDAAEVVDHHGGALAGQQHGYRPADAPAGAGDDRDPPVQTCHASSPRRPQPRPGCIYWNLLLELDFRRGLAPVKAAGQGNAAKPAPPRSPHQARTRADPGGTSRTAPRQGPGRLLAVGQDRGDPAGAARRGPRGVHRAGLRRRQHRRRGGARRIQRGQPVPPLRRQERAVHRAVAGLPARPGGGRERGRRAGQEVRRDRPVRAVLRGRPGLPGQAAGSAGTWPRCSTPETGRPASR